MTEHEFWTDIRQALLMLVDTVERKMEQFPRTALLRKAWKCGIIDKERLGQLEQPERSA